MSGSLRRRSEKIIQSNISYPRGSEVPLSPRESDGSGSFQHEKISGVGKRSVLLSAQEERIGGA